VKRCVREAFDKFAAELDRHEIECLAVELKIASGKNPTPAERIQYTQWVAEGKPRWRKTRSILRRIKHAARKASRTQARDR
jgi:hypothetical protein